MSSLFSKIAQGFSNAFRNWKLLLVLFIMNVIIGYILSQPMRWFLSDALASSEMATLLNGNLDFTLWTELSRVHASGFNLLIKSVLISFPLYLIWTVFYTGGLIGHIHHNSTNDLKLFWSSGAKYFFRFLRLAIYILLVIGLFAGVMFFISGIPTTSILEYDTEMTLIYKFRFILGILLVLLFLISIFKDITKFHIASNNRSIIIGEIWAGIKSSFRLRSILIGLVFLLLQMGLFLLYLGAIRMGLDKTILSIAVIPQLIMFLQFVLQYARLYSFDKVVDKKPYPYPEAIITKT